MKTFIENENVTFKEVNLFEVPAIPDDIKVLMIDGPQYDLSDREMKMLRDFWNKDGRILLLIDPAAKTPKLDAFLNELGVKVDDDRLMAMVKTGIEEVARVRDVVARFLPDNPVTKRLARCPGSLLRVDQFVNTGFATRSGGEYSSRAASSGGERLLGRD